jgi:tryptophanyl-tRNA synthetase
MTKGRIFSGIQPTGIIHLGNYVGAIQQWVKLMQDYDCIYCIVDYHAITIEYEVQTLGDNIMEAAVTLLACGLDPEHCKLFVQSQVPEHTELSWLFNCITPIGDLERMTQFKEKSEQHREHINLGLLGYPVLQTADIIIYRARYVPVGIDQVPHLELSREVARRFNFLYREVFPEPEPLLTEFPKVPGLDGRKMSKSYDNAIYLSDSPEVVEQKIKTMMTDPARKRRTDRGEPELSPVFQLHKIFSSKEEIEEVAHGCKTAGIGCLDCKRILISRIFESLDPIWRKRDELIRNPAVLLEIARKGSERASVVAEETMKAVREIMGLR